MKAASRGTRCAATRRLGSFGRLFERDLQLVVASKDISIRAAQSPTFPVNDVESRWRSVMVSAAKSVSPSPRSRLSVMVTF